MHKHTQSPAVSSTGKHTTLRRRAENLAAVLIWTGMVAVTAIYPAAVAYWAGRGA